MEKFPEAHALLLKSGVLKPGAIREVEPAERRLLLRVHTEGYLQAIEKGELEPSAIRVLGLPPGPELLERSAREVEGTRQACLAALDSGLAANLAGGTHHAFPGRGEGFCVLNDVAVAVRDLQQLRPGLRILVVDTDAHQGNGTHAIFQGDSSVFTYSIHVGPNYPSKKVPGSLDVALPRYVGGEKYLRQLQTTLPAVLDRFYPELVIWISGADPHRNDRFGQMQLSLAEMQQRDAWVAGLFFRKGIPLAVLYGGGYNRQRGCTAKLHCNTVVTTTKVWEETL